MGLKERHTRSLAVARGGALTNSVRRRPVPAAAVLACAALFALCAGAPPATNRTELSGAHVARSLRVIDTADMHRVSCNCNDIAEEGKAEGSLPGRFRAYVNVGSPIIFRFTIIVHGVGTLSGEGSGKPKGNPAEPSFRGTMKVTGGTGRYRHAHGTGDFRGTINRSSYAAVMQTTGTLSY
jgi:hypothetical protein